MKKNPLDNLKPFKKGQSGNPKGRPVGAKSRSTIAKRWLETEEKLKNPITGTQESLSQEDIITLSLVKKARSGDVSAYKSLMDSAYGAPIQQTDITTDGEPIKTTFNLIGTPTEDE